MFPSSLYTKPLVGGFQSYTSNLCYHAMRVLESEPKELLRYKRRGRSGIRKSRKENQGDHYEKVFLG